MNLKLLKITALCALSLLASCTADRYFDMDGSKEGSPTPSTKNTERVSSYHRNVLIYVSGGKNNLAGYLRDDLADLENGPLPSNFPEDHAVAVLYRNAYNSSAPAAPVLFRLYKDRNGNPVRDTFKVWSGTTPIFGNGTLTEAMNIIKEKLPAAGYGMVLSSHGSGYVPEGYYSDPDSYDGTGGSTTWGKVTPMSVGQDVDGSVSVEMELRELRDAIPYHLDYILFDACLMGGVETAFELREKADIIGFSQTEILAEGFDYQTIAGRLLKKEPDPVQVCADYFEQYREHEDPKMRSATISAIKTSELGKLAEVCKVLFEKYRDQISTVNYSSVQRYYRFGRHYYYDMKDILDKSGVSEEDMAGFNAALEKCVLYEAHTDQFLSSINLSNCCGLSMYLPSHGSAFLSKFYKENLDWNDATELVK